MLYKFVLCGLKAFCGNALEQSIQCIKAVFAIEQPLDQRCISNDIGGGHGVGRANLQVGLQANIGELHGNSMLDFLVRHGLVCVDLAKGFFAVSPAAVLGHHYGGGVQNKLGIALKCEVFVKRSRNKSAAVAVCVPPNVGSHQLVCAGLPLKYGGVIAYQAQQRN